jgi:hypothetical protein
VNDTTETADDGPIYAFKPRMLAAEHAFRLGTDSLEWIVGGRPGRVAYAMIARIRLGFRLTNFMGRRYTAEIFPRTGARMEISSYSARGIVDNANQGAAYRAFISELHRRVAKAHGDCRFEAGMAVWRFWPSVAVTVAMMAGLVYVVARGMLGDQIVTGLIVLAVGALFVWQMGKMVLANRPRSYRPEAIPEDVLRKFEWVLRRIYARLCGVT